MLLVDGHNLLFQMFYGMPNQILDRNGHAIHGTIGFVGALLKIIRRLRPSHVAVVFDGETHNPRKDLDENYKANRPDWSQMDEEETPFSQLPDIYRALDALGICHKETETCEADDWLAGFAQTLGKEHRVTICSQDSDFFQLITKNVQILRYRGEHSVLCNEAYIQEKLGICPCQYADFKSLTGDTADNIRGADKVGPKTAAALMSEFGDLDNLLAHVEEVQKPSVRASLMESRERLMKNRQLICLSWECPLPFTMEDMVFTDKGLSTMQVLNRIGIQ